MMCDYRYMIYHNMYIYIYIKKPETTVKSPWIAEKSPWLGLALSRPGGAQCTAARLRRGPTGEANRNGT